MAVTECVQTATTDGYNAMNVVVMALCHALIVTDRVTTLTYPAVTAMARASTALTERAENVAVPAALSSSARAAMEAEKSIARSAMAKGDGTVQVATAQANALPAAVPDG